MMGRKVYFCCQESSAPGNRFSSLKNNSLGDRAFGGKGPSKMFGNGNPGLAGIARNGQQELCAALAGLRPLKEGAL